MSTEATMMTTTKQLYQRTIRVFSYVTIALIVNTTEGMATDFQGHLNSVSMSDAASANKPPVAQFAYTRDGDTYTFSANESYDPDGKITDFRWDFGDGNIQHTSTAQFTSKTEFTVQLTVLDDASGITLRKQSIVPAKPYSMAVSFQPDNVNVEDGFVIDSGLSYDKNRGFGWTILPQADGARDRNSSESPNQSYDTMIHVRSTGKWEIEVPNGQYQVTVCMGDPSYPIGTNFVQLNEVPLFTGETLSATQKWIEKTTVLEVTSSMISLTFVGSSHPARLSWLTITSK